MTLASTSRVQVAYAKETVFGTIDSAAPSKNLRVTSEGLVYNVTKETSAELNKNRGSSSMVPVSAEASGPLSGEMSYGEWDEFMAAVLQADEGWKVTAGTGLALTVTATEVTSGTAEPSFLFMQPGQWFVLPGSVEGKNKGKLLRVHPVTAPTDTVITLDPLTPGVPEVIASSDFSSSRISNGTKQDSFTLERQTPEVSEFFAYRGMTAASMTLTLASGAISTIEVNFMGKDTKPDGATLLKNPTLPSFTGEVMSGAAGTSCGVYWKGAPIDDAFMNQVTLSYDNALRMQQALCSLGAIGIGSGTIVLTVEVQMFFAQGRKFYDEFLGNSNNELAFTMFDTEGNGYMCTLPKANVSNYAINAGGKDQDLMVTTTFTGLLDMDNVNPALRGKLLFIDRTGKLPVRPA